MGLAFLIPALFFLPNRAAADGAPALGGASNDESDGPGNVIVDVVVDMTDAGKKVERPTPENPAYYLPLPIGYKEIGYAPHYQKAPPTPAEVETLLNRELSKQDYLVMSHEHHPSLVLTFFWGYIDPGPDWELRQGPSLIPGDQLREMLFGDEHPTNWNKVHPNHKMDGYEWDRHGHWYVLVTAFDFPSWLKNLNEEKHKKSGEKVADQPILLWRAHISTELWGHFFDEVLPTLITTAGPMLGRETAQPQYITAPVEPAARVIVGTPQVKDFPAKPPPP